VEGEADAASIGTDADVVVEEVVTCLGVLDWAFAAAGRPHFLINISWPLYSAYVIITENENANSFASRPPAFNCFSKCIHEGE